MTTVGLTTFAWLFFPVVGQLKYITYNKSQSPVTAVEHRRAHLNIELENVLSTHSGLSTKTPPIQPNNTTSAKGMFRNSKRLTLSQQ